MPTPDELPDMPGYHDALLKRTLDSRDYVRLPQKSWVDPLGCAVSPEEQFRPLIAASEFAAAFEGVMERCAKEIAAVQGKLTKEQFVEALRQAIACGDFVRLCTVGKTTSVDGRFLYTQQQAVTYEPYRECERLRARIAELERQLEEIEARIANAFA